FLTIDGGPSMATVTALPGGTGISISMEDTGRFIFRNLRIKGDPNYVFTTIAKGLEYRPTFTEDFGKLHYGSSEIFVQNVVVEGFSTGIDVNLHSSNRVAIPDVTINQCPKGISMQTSSGNIVSTVRGLRVHNASIAFVAGNGTR